MGAKIDHDQIAVTHKVARGSGETANSAAVSSMAMRISIALVPRGNEFLYCFCGWQVIWCAPRNVLTLHKFWIQDTLWHAYSQGRFQVERHQKTLSCKAHCLADEGIDIGRLLDLLCGRRAAAVAGAGFDP